MLAVPFYFVFTQSSPYAKSESGLFSSSFFFPSEMFCLESSLTQSDIYGAHWWSNSSWLLKPHCYTLIQSTRLVCAWFFILFYLFIIFFLGPKAASMIYNPDGSQTERGYVLNAELPGSPVGTYWVCCLSLLVKFIATPSPILLTKALGLRFPAYLSNRCTCEGSSSR